MKKVIIIFLLLIMIVPFNVFASSDVTYSSSSINGPDSVKTGDKVKFDFNIKFSGLKKDTYDTKGLLMLIFELNFDPSVLQITGIETADWDSEVIENGGKYYVFSSIGDNDSNTCKDNFLHCGDYNATLEIFIKDTDDTNGFIEMGHAEFYLYEVNDDDEYEYSKNELITKDYHIHKTKNFSIEKAEGKKEAPKSIITKKEEKPTETVKQAMTETKSNIQTKDDKKEESKEENKESKSNNKYLKTLEIEGYKIDFSKSKKLYDIVIKNKVNTLKINAIAEDEKATVEIIGADDLKKSNYEVTVKVTAEDGSKSNYVIIAKKDKKENKKAPFYKKYKKELIIGGSVIVFLGLIIFIINLVNNKKIDKALKF